MSDGAFFGWISAGILALLVALTVWAGVLSSEAVRACEAAGGEMVSTFSHYEPQMIWTGKVAITIQRPVYDTECVR